MFFLITLCTDSGDSTDDSPAIDDNTELIENKKLVEIIRTTPDLSIFYQALRESYLVGLCNISLDKTLIISNNQAF